MSPRTPVLLSLVLAACLLPGCRSSGSSGSGARTGTAVGAVAGGTDGCFIGEHNDHKGTGVAIGAVLGGLLGYAVGNEADRSREYHPPRATSEHRAPPLDDVEPACQQATLRNRRPGTANRRM